MAPPGPPQKPFDEPISNTVACQGAKTTKRGLSLISMKPVLAFDIETIPDVAGIRRLHDLPADLPDHEVAEVAFQKRRAQTGNDFLGPQLHRVVVIGCLLREGDAVKV